MVISNAMGRSLVGKVISNKMQKTIVVIVMRTIRHPKYGKIIKRRTKLHAHDENQVCEIGNTVRIVESKPISKMKTWVLDEVLK